MVKVVRCGDRQILLRTLEDQEDNFSFLKVIDRVDQFPENYEDNICFREKVLYLSSHEGTRVGFIPKYVVDEMIRCCGQQLFFDIFTLKSNENSLDELRFNDDKAETRNAKIDHLGRILYEKSELKEIKGWRDERYGVYVQGSSTPYLLVERAMAGILGIITYGIHVNGYVVNESTGEIKFWVPRRSATKSTWPLKLDNVVAGGIGYPYTVTETLIKESMEEANLRRTVIENRIRSVGVLSYMYFPQHFDRVRFDDESCNIVGEVEYVFDLLLSQDIVPRPNDGEVENFSLLSLQETIDAIIGGEFKPNCALVMVDFLIRHGYITTENEPFFLELVCRMHRKLPFPQLHFH